MKLDRQTKVLALVFGIGMGVIAFTIGMVVSRKTPTTEVGGRVVEKTDSLGVVEFDGHLIIQGKAYSAIMHHPDCPCKKD